MLSCPGGFSSSAAHSHQTDSNETTTPCFQTWPTDAKHIILMDIFQLDMCNVEFAINMVRLALAQVQVQS
jgi:hypothetical protein